ncbi:MAG: hypothetical protein AAFU79_30415, partial [Myxococcota bacterium]
MALRIDVAFDRKHDGGMASHVHPYQVGDDLFDAHVVRPETSDRLRPAVLIAHAWGGRSAFEEGKADALAE